MRGGLGRQRAEERERERERERESVGGRGRRADALPRLSPSCFVESRIGEGRGEKGERREWVEGSVPTECWVPCVISSSPPVVSFWGEGFQEPRLPAVHIVITGRVRHDGSFQVRTVVLPLCCVHLFAMHEEDRV